MIFVSCWPRRGPSLHLRATPSPRWLLLLGILLALPASAPAQVAAVSGATLAAIAKRPDLWPREVTLKVAQPAPDRRTPAVPPGATVKVVGLEGPLIGIDYQGTLLMVPVAQTDFLEKGAALLASGRTAPRPPRSSGQPRVRKRWGRG